MAIIKKFRIKSFKKKKSIVSFKKVSLSFGNRRIINEISFDVNHGEILGILGPNGVGKSTIFNLITGLIKPDSGEVLFENKNITDLPMYLRTKKFNIGFVPQHGGFFHDLTLFENLKAIAEIIIKTQRESLQKINFLISKFELDSVRDIKAKFLSGGQKRKLVIALALIGSNWIGSKTLLERMLGKELQLTRRIWERLTWFWGFGFIGIAVINAYFVNAALSARQRFFDNAIPVDPKIDLSKLDCSKTILESLCLSAQQTEEAWVNFKLFGTLGLTLLLVVITVVILSKNIKERESVV